MIMSFWFDYEPDKVVYIVYYYNTPLEQGITYCLRKFYFDYE